MHAEQNYIYIVFAVLYIIYSIVKGAKKVKANRPGTKPVQPAQSRPVNPPASPIPGKGDDLKELLEQVLGKPPVAEPTPQPVTTVKPKSVSPRHHEKSGKAIQSHLPSRSAKKAKPFLQGEHFVHEPEKPVITFAETEEQAPLLRDEFDLRKAIIFSEILNRPKY